MDKCAKCRKAGAKLFLKGERCSTPKCAFSRRSYAPGDHGPRSSNRRRSEYAIQLAEKQKAKAEYFLLERQFVKTFREAARSRKNTGEELLRRLELRFDNIIYRLGWAASRLQARQMITHDKFKLNNQKANIPSIVLKPKDIIIPKNDELLKPIKVTVPRWLKLDPKQKKAEVISLPSADQIESDIDTQLIIEFYSR